MGHLTNAAVLLFAKNIMRFNMNCRIRFIRIDGREMQVGENYNVIKDKSIDEPILRLVYVAKAFIADQLREFTKQEHGRGKFVESPGRFPNIVTADNISYTRFSRNKTIARVWRVLESNWRVP